MTSNQHDDDDDDGDHEGDGYADPMHDKDDDYDNEDDDNEDDDNVDDEDDDNENDGGILLVTPMHRTRMDDANASYRNATAQGLASVPAALGWAAGLEHHGFNSRRVALIFAHPLRAVSLVKLM